MVPRKLHYGLRVDLIQRTYVARDSHGAQTEATDDLSKAVIEPVRIRAGAMHTTRRVPSMHSTISLSMSSVRVVRAGTTRYRTEILCVGHSLRCTPSRHVPRNHCWSTMSSTDYKSTDLQLFQCFAYTKCKSNNEIGGCLSSRIQPMSLFQPKRNLDQPSSLRILGQSSAIRRYGMSVSSSSSAEHFSPSLCTSSKS